VKNGTSPTQRAKFINGLRDLASFLDTNPGFPVPSYGSTVHVFPEGLTDAERRAAVDRLAALMGTTAHDDNGHYKAVAQFGPVAYYIVAISDASRAAHRARDSYADCIQLDEPDDLGTAA
jgi:hypothetical protein